LHEDEELSQASEQEEDADAESVVMEDAVEI